MGHSVVELPPVSPVVLAKVNFLDLFMHESIVFCSACTMSSQRKFTFAISSSDEFLVNSDTVCYRLSWPLANF